MASINLFDRAQEVFTVFDNHLYGKIARENKSTGEPDMAAHIVPIIDKLSAAFTAKYAKEIHSDFARPADEVYLTEAYILALNFAGVFNLIIDNKKLPAKKGTTIGATILDIINTLSKIGKASATISDHSLISSAINQIVNYADRNSYEIEEVYQIKLSKLRGEAAPLAVAS